MKRLSMLLLGLALAACRPSAPETPPGDLDLGAGRYPAVAADPASGAVYAAWVETAEAGARVRLARMTPAGAVSDPIELATGTVGAQSQAAPVIAAGPEGTVYAVWSLERVVEGRRFPASDLVLARSTDGGRTFSAPVPVHPDPGFPTGHSFHSLAVGPEGTVYVAWLDGTARDRYRSAHPPTEPMAHAATADPHHGPRDPEAPGTDVVVARSTDGGRSFEAPVVVARNTCECCRTALDVATDGAVTLAWRHHYDGNLRDVALARSTDGGRTFAAPVRVHADGWAIDGCPHAGPAVATAADGTLHVVWFTGAPDSSGVRHAVSTDGGATFATDFLQADVPLAQVRAARDGAGRVWLAWEDPAADAVRLRAAESPEEAVVLPGAAPALTPLADGGVLARTAEGQVRLRVVAEE